jgi:methionyl-tRNA formyltransferase
LKNQKGELKSFKIFSSRKTEIKSTVDSELSETKDGILFPCADFYLLVKEIQPEGKRRMSFNEFLAGNRLSDWRIDD